MNFLKDKTGKISTMRVSLFLLVIAAVIILLSIAFYIIVKGFEGGVDNWSGMGVFVISVGGLITGISWQKKEQKKLE